MPKSITLSTENLNHLGTWLPVAGAQLQDFRRNPVMFYDHQTYKMPIGHWENVRIENSRIIADPVFDEKDPDAQDVKRKWENGDINGASLGVDVLELSDDPSMLKPGQIRPTVTKYKVYEASITPLPDNADCLTLRRGSLSLASGASMESVDLFLPEIKPTFKMEKIALKLGLAKEATEEQIIGKIDGLLANEKSLLTLKKHIDGEASSLEADAKEAFDSLIEKDPENALRVLKLARKQPALPATEPGEETEPEEKPAKVSDLIKQTLSRLGEKTGDQEDKESFDYLQRNDPQKLVNLRRTDPAKFQKLADEYYAGKRVAKK